jgi:uncharacterized repeat protein (TIGR01451 family)
MLSSTGKISAPALPLNIGRANLSLSALPDHFDIVKDDEITWTILLENDGDGTAYDVVVNITLPQGLQLLSIDSPGQNWSYASLAPGQIEQITLKARAIETQSSYSTLFIARWGSGPCQEISQLSELGARTAIRKQPDQPRSLAVGEVAPTRSLPTCPKEPAICGSTIPFQGA